MRAILAMVRLVFLLTILTVSNEGLGMSDVSSEMVRAARFEDWNAAIGLAPRLDLQSEADFGALIALLDACAAKGCKRNPPQMLRGQWVTPTVNDFARAWVDYSTGNPARGRDAFRSLSANPERGWLGMYGLLQYAMDTGNAELIRATVRESKPFLKDHKSMAEAAADAELLLVVLMQELGGLPNALASIGQHASTESRFERELDYLVWKGDFTAAQSFVEAYINRYGNDHVSARASVELMQHMAAPDRVLAEIERKLRIHPTYWWLVATRVTLAEGDEKRAEAFIKAQRQLPMNLSYLRLLRFYRLAHGSSRRMQEAAKAQDELSSSFNDYPMFHVSAAQIAQRLGNVPLAMKHLDIAIQQSPRDIGALSARGVLALEANRTSEAIQYLAQVAKFDPNNVYSQMILAKTYLMAEDYAAARQTLRQIRSSKAFIPQEQVAALEREIEDAERRTGKK